MRSDHSRQRGDEGRPVQVAFNDAQQAKPSDVFVQTIEDELTDFTADLLALAANEPVLRRLFEHPFGYWSDLESFLCGHAEMAQALASLQSECGGKLQVTWLKHPELGRGYCLVLFYVDSLGWNSLALCNKARLETTEQVACSVG